MRNPGGYRLITEDGRANIENDTFTCHHCNGIVIVPPGQIMLTTGATCRACMRQVCDRCAGEMDRTLKCTPFEAKMERMESRDRLLRSLGIE